MSQENIEYAESLGLCCESCMSNNVTIDEAHQDYEYLNVDYDCNECGYSGEVVVEL